MILKDIEDLKNINITELIPDNGHLYVIQVNIGDMPRENIHVHLLYIKSLFDSRGITNTIFIPVTNNGEGCINIKELINDN